MKKKVFIISGVVVGVLGLCAMGAMAGMSEIKKLTINSVSLESIPDGVYKGSYHKGRWTYDAEVTLANRAIVSVKNTNNKMDIMKELNNKIEAAFVKHQSPKIDVVSGATINTKAYSKAVEVALTSKSPQ